MTMESQTRELPALSLRASFRPETVNEEKRTVELVWTTGARVKRGGWWTEPYWEELSLDPKHVRMGRLNNGAPFLRDHGGLWSAGIEHVLGVVETARLAATEGVAVVRFPRAEDDPEADKVFRKVRDGILQNVSVGYRVHKLVKVEQTDGEIPVMRAEDWEPYEISLVAMGADDGAGTRSAQRGEAPPPMNPCEFVTRGVEPQKESKMPEQQTRTETNTTPPAVDVEKVRAEERQRAVDITALVRKAKLAPEVADGMIERNLSLDAARAEVLEAVMKRSAEGGPSEAPSGAGVQVTRAEEDTKRLRASSWLIQRTGFSQLVEQARSKPVFAQTFRGDVVIDPGEARGSSLLDMARAFLESRGVKTGGMTKMELAGRALSFNRSSGPYQGTDSFPVLFEDALRKILLAAYATQADTWRLFCGTDTVPDFRPSPRYRTGEMGGTLDHLNEHGEFKNKSIPDGARTDVSTETRGNMIALTREAIINDDMGALANLAATFGRLAGRTIEVDVYALLAKNGGLGPTLPDGNTFFHASRGNVGTGAALGVSGLQADKVLMRRQKDLNGVDFIDLRPQTLLVPDSLEADANVFNDSEFDPRDNNFRKPNTVRGLFSTVIGSPRLSGTRRYMFADPAGGAVAIKVVFLEGQGEGPVMEMQEGWRTDGTEWKIRTDVKVEPFDPKGAVTNAGA
jgi:HK97 family phage prohead protease